MNVWYHVAVYNSYIDISCRPDEGIITFGMGLSLVDAAWHSHMIAHDGPIGEFFLL